MKRPFILLRAEGIRLTVEATAAEVPEVKWIHVASEGTYRGHPSGPFELDAKVFGTMVANFKADPRFKLDDAGRGSSPVVPYDYEHASEMAAFLGSIPERGTPAPAWALDLEARTGEDGKAQLWALTKLGRTIRQQIQDDEYQFVSIAFNSKAVDQKSGKDVGHKITSIAFTNQPFLTDLTPIPIAASARFMMGDYWASPSGSPEEAFEQVRTLMGLPATTDTAAVVAEIEKVLGWAAGQGLPPQGLEVDGLVAALRTAFGLPVTSTLDELGAEIRKASDALVPGSTTDEPKTTQDTSKDESMLSDLGKKIAAILAKRRVTLTRVTLLQEDADVERAVEELATSGSDLQSILGALGVNDPGKALENVAELKSAKTKLDSVQQELDSQLAMAAKVEEQQGMVDVNAALKAKGWEKDASVALSTHRSRIIEEQVEAAKVAATNAGQNVGKAVAQAREDGRKKFLSHYGVPEAQHAHLLSLLVAGPGGAQLQPPAAPPEARTLSIGGDGNDDGEGEVIDLSAYEGVNETQKIQQHILKSNPNLNPFDLIKRVRSLRESGARFIGGAQQ